jgi:hypothetical protein
LADDDGARRDRDRPELGREPLQRRRGQRREDRDPLEQVEVRGSVRGRVDHHQLPPRDRGERRQEGARGHQRPARPDEVDQRRSQCSSQTDRCDQDHLEHAEHTADHGGRSCALQQCQPGHVDEGVPDAEHDESGQRDPEVRPDPDRHERRAPEHDPQAEVGGEPLATDQCERREGAEGAADAHGGVEEPDRRIASVQELERRDDHEDAKRSGDQRLRGVEQDDDAEPPVAADRPKAAGRLAPETAAPSLDLPLLLFRWGARMDRRDERCSPDEGRRADDHHGSRDPEREECSRDRRSGEGADAVDRAADDVRGGEFLGCSGELGEQGGLGREEGGPEDRCQPGERVHDPRRATGQRDDPCAPDRRAAPEVRHRHERHAREAVGHR